MKDVGAVAVYINLRRGITIFVLVCLVISNIFSFSLSANENPDSLVDAVFIIEYFTGTKLSVTASMTAHKLTTDRAYTASEIESASDQEMGALRHSLYLLLQNQVNEIFKGAERTGFQMPVYSNGIFKEEFTVDLTSKFFNINESINAETLVNGALDCGATVTYAFNLVSEQGWNNTFIFVLPESMNLSSANTDQVITKAHKKELTWKVLWTGAFSSRQAVLSTRLSNPTTKHSNEEDISLVFYLNSRNVNSIGFSTEFIIGKADIRAYEIIPSFISDFDFIPSDGVRLLIQNDMLSWHEFYEETIKPIEQKSISLIERSSFNQTLEMEFEWDADTTINCSVPYNITHMDSNPPIFAELISTSPINLEICGISSRAFIGLINAGAKANISNDDINFGDRLNEIGLPFHIHLYLPTGVYLDGNNIFQWNESVYLFGDFHSDLKPSPEYSEEKINTHIEIDIIKVDLNIPSFFTGKTEFTATAYAKEETSHFILSLPSNFSLPDKIDLLFLNSDALRLCIQENVFGREEIDSFLSNKKELFERKISFILSLENIKGFINREVFTHSQNWDGDISSMDASSPIITSLYSNNLYPISFNLSFWPPKVNISNQTFILSGLHNQSVTYKILFPKGISITATDSKDKPILKKTTAEGREYIEITFTASDEENIMVVTCALSASSLYMLGQFLPCILSFILVIVLIVLVLLFKKKRKGRTVKINKKPDSSGYEEESYYVSPPPSK
ncbi:MAG: hypothetical protein R6V50_02035 [Thermoplasmatota archaeon]